MAAGSLQYWYVGGDLLPMTLWDMIELRRFNPETMLGQKNMARRREAIRRLFEEPISEELEAYLRKVSQAALFESMGRVPHSAWRIVRRSTGYEVEDYLCKGGDCGHGA